MLLRSSTWLTGHCDKPRRTSRSAAFQKLCFSFDLLQTFALRYVHCLKSNAIVNSAFPEIKMFSLAPRSGAWLLSVFILVLPMPVWLFATGFFPYKPVMPGRNRGSSSMSGPVPAAPFDKVIFMVVDALRRYKCSRTWVPILLCLDESDLYGQ